MEFKLPFPTLKSLSSLSICLHWIDDKIGAFEDFPMIGYFDEETLRESHLSIDGLPISDSLKAVVGDVLVGIMEQLRFWISQREYNRLVLEHVLELQYFRFDAFGRFDEKRTLKPLFQKKIAEEDDLSSLHDLLTEAHDFWLLPEVDEIFRKMVAIASKRRRSKILMEGPQPELRDGKCHLVYRFLQEDAAQFLKSIPCLQCTDVVEIILKRKSISVAPCADDEEEEEIYGRRNWNFDAFKDHFELFEPPEREAFIVYVLGYRNRYHMDMKNQLAIFTFLKQRNDQRNWMLEIKHGHFSRFFEKLIIWPYAVFFIVTLEHLAEHLTSDDYLIIFSRIVDAIPDEEQYGVLYRNLLLDYWSVLTAEKKRMCATLGSDYFHEAVDDLKVKAPFLHDTIKTELDSFVAATNKE